MSDKLKLFYFHIFVFILYICNVEVIIVYNGQDPSKFNDNLSKSQIWILSNNYLTFDISIRLIRHIEITAVTRFCFTPYS